NSPRRCPPESRSRVCSASPRAEPRSAPKSPRCNEGESVTCHLRRTSIVNPLRAFFISLPVCAIAAAGQAALDTAPVTDVGAREILVGDLRDELPARRKQDLARNKLDAFTPAGRDDALRELIDRKLFAAAARDEGLDRQPDVARRLENVIDQFLAQT